MRINPSVKGKQKCSIPKLVRFKVVLREVVYIDTYVKKE
jgi:hypothetical protein